MVAHWLYRKLRSLPRPVGPAVERLCVSIREQVYDAEVLPGVVVRQSVPRHNDIWRERLSRTSGHERGVCEWLLRNLRPSDVFYDVGAHYGFYPMLVSTVCPEVEIHAFEPDPHPRGYLRRNAARSRSAAPWAIVDKLVGREENGFSVTLDAYAVQHPRPTIVKMDIEGAEVLALAGARRLIESGEVEFLVEIHPEEIESFGSSVERLMGLFPDSFDRRVLVDIRNSEQAIWTNDLTALFTDDHPYVYFGPSTAEREFQTDEAPVVTHP